jgi:hypothetical protein
MMLLERWVVAAMLGIGLISTAGLAPGQTSSGKSQVVRPKEGPPPDQAEQPDPPAQAESNAEPEPAAQPDPAPDQAAAPDPPAQPQQAATPDPSTQMDPPTQPQPAAASEQETPPEPPATPGPAEPSQQAVVPEAPPKPAAQPAAPPPPAAPVGNAAQQQLQKETATLLQLAQDLKAEIEKAGSNTLSLVALRKADEIQKLSKNLRQAMKEQEQVPEGK